MVRIGELLGALSLATDLGAGMPLETSLRTCVLATRLARRLALPDVIAVRRTTLLRHLGCTAFAHEAARIAGDDHDLLTTFAGVDLTRRAALAGRTMTRLGRGTGFSRRVATVAKAVTRPRAGAALIAAQGAQAGALAEDPAMPAHVAAAPGHIYERPDGRGAPHGVAGDAI